MTYLRRAFKYLVQLTLLFILLVGILMLAGMIPKDIAIAFRKGWTSIFYILGIFALMAAVYPLFGYGKRTIRATGEPSEHWKAIDEALEERGYVLSGETEDGGRRYHLKASLNRAARLWEDSITLTPMLGGFQAEGLVRDLARVGMSIDRKINRYD